MNCKMKPEELELLVFRFSDPHQQRIYEELKEIVGPGPAANFRDACWLMANPEILDTTAHLVAHLLREIESAIRALFKPVVRTECPNANSSKSHKEEIRSILSALNIEEEAPEAKAWFELVNRKKGLNRLAHRRGLDAPRHTNEIKPLWKKSQDLLYVLVKALRERFLIWIRELDKLLEIKQPTKEDATRLAQEFPNNRVVRKYFFKRLDSPEWFGPLRKKGFFKIPPTVERDEEHGTIHCPSWPESQYLVRMARRKPDRVAQVIQDMDDTDNAAVHLDLVNALLAMPSNVSVLFVEKAACWAGSPYLRFPELPEKLGQFISHLAKGGKTEEAMAIARVLLEVLPDFRRRQADELNEPSHLSPEPQARLDTWRYEQILKEHYPDLVRKAGLPALKLLCDLLEEAVRLSRTREDDQSWRTAVEDHPQKTGHTIKNALVSAVRDAAELVVRTERGTIEEAVNTLESKPWKVFRRIALHVLRMFPDQAKALATARLTDRSLFEDVGLWHEYGLLLRDHFTHLPLKDQNRILEWIEEGPKEDVNIDPEIWERDWLARIGTESLPEKGRDRYRNLVRLWGNPDPPKFPVCAEGDWENPTSPKTADEIKAMSVTEVVEFLKTWEPRELLFCGPSPEGLGDVLLVVVAEDPRRFATEATRFTRLHPTYVRSVLSGLGKAVKQDRAFDWGPVLDLCDWVLSQPLDFGDWPLYEGDPETNWSWTRQAIADLLSAGFDDRRSGIPIGHRKRVWATLKSLIDELDPTPDYELCYGPSNMSPATLSNMTLQGKAMHAVVRHALWVRRHLEREPRSQERSQKGFEEMPEVREVLEAHLDPAQDPSLAVRAVYGQWFPWLAQIDPDWASTHAARVFPQDQEGEVFFEAAWSTYIAFCRPYDNVLEVLRPFYRLAVDRIGGWRDDMWWRAAPDERLAKHLMAFYCRGKLSLDDSLFALFWEKAPDAVKAHAIEFVGQVKEDIPEETLDRLKRLWERRLAAAKQAQRASDFEEEIAAFGWWFVSGKFDTEWVIEQLVEALQIVGKAEPDHMVVEKLAEIVENYPLEAVESLRMIFKSDHEGWFILGCRRYARNILEVALQDVAVRQKAERLIHYLGSRGYLEFRDLLHNSCAMDR